MSIVLNTGVYPPLLETRRLILEGAGHVVITTAEDQGIVQACKDYPADVAVIDLVKALMCVCGSVQLAQRQHRFPVQVHAEIIAKNCANPRKRKVLVALQLEMEDAGDAVIDHDLFAPGASAKKVQLEPTWEAPLA